LIKPADEVLAQGDLEQVVDYAIDLSRRKVEIDRELEKAKVYLREEAKKQGKGSFEVELEGLTGTITVTFPGLMVRVRKGADLKDLEVNLPPEVFAELFKRTIEIVPAEAAEEFLEVLGRLSPAHRASVKHFIEVVERTPAVYLPK
jgi:hypothetical protein